MFNPLKNPKILGMIFSHAEKELNNALIYRQEQFNNPNLYFEAILEGELPKICLSDPTEGILVKLTVAELLQDPVTEKQLRKIPKILRKLIDWQKLTNYVNLRLLEQVTTEQSLQATRGSITANISIKKGQPSAIQTVTLKDLFGW